MNINIKYNITEHLFVEIELWNYFINSTVNTISYPLLFIRWLWVAKRLWVVVGEECRLVQYFKLLHVIVWLIIFTCSFQLHFFLGFYIYRHLEYLNKKKYPMTYIYSIISMIMISSYNVCHFYAPRENILLTTLKQLFFQHSYFHSYYWIQILLFYDFIMKLIYQVYLTHRWKFSRSNQTPRPKDGESLLIGKPNPVHIRNMGPTHFCIWLWSLCWDKVTQQFSNSERSHSNSFPTTTLGFVKDNLL